ncbi:hypothetical protein ISCGN_010628 [Ixodes scapularis]
MAEPQPPQPKQTLATAEAQPVASPHDYPTNSNDTDQHADQRGSPDAAASMQPPSTQPTRPPSRAAARCKSAARTLALPYSDSKRPRRPSASSTGTNLTDRSELLATDTMETEDEPQSQDSAGVESLDVVATDYLDATQDAAEDCSWQDVYYKSGKLRYGRSRCNETTPDTNMTAEIHREENDRFVVVFRSAERYNLATLPLENLVKAFYGALGLDRRNCEDEQKLLIRTGSTTNTVSVITKTRAQVPGLLKIKAIRAPDREVSVIAHELPPSNTTRGVIRGINATYSPEQLMRELDCKSHEILFARKLEVSQLNHEDNQVVYVDTATNATAASAAVVFLREAQDAPLTVRKVYTKLTSPQATEEAAILLALQTYENLATSNSHTRNHLTIYTDSQEAIRSLVKHHTTTTSPTIAAIFQSALRIHREHGTKTSVRWVPGHAGIQGNAAAHRAAREVLQTAALPDGHAKTARNLIPGTEPIEEAYDPKEEIRKIRAQVRKQILNTWTAEPYPIPEKIFKRHQTVLLRRVRTGGAITPHQTYIFELNRKRKTDPYFVPTDPRCHRCKHPDKLPKLQHLLWECEALRETRQTVWATLPPDEVPSSVREWTHPIGDAERRTSILGSLLEFISSGGLSNSL